MERGVLNLFFLRIVLGLFIVLMGSCASSATNYKKRYNKVWKELIKSQAWQDALEKKKVPRTGDEALFYVSTDDKAINYEGNMYGFRSNNLFSDKYNLLVVRAYEKIIAEAVEADARLEKEYVKWNTTPNRIPIKGDRSHKKNLAEVNRLFHAHREMLEGLKSWNIFSEYGSNDLEFFMAENKSYVYQMYSEGENESKMINYLIYKLADLYHFEN